MKVSQLVKGVTSLFGFWLLVGLCAPVARADFVFAEPVDLKAVIPVIDPVHESIDCFSPDGLEIYLASDRPGGSGGYDVWVVKRDTIDSDWKTPENLGPAVNSASHDNGAWISSDGLTLHFCSGRPGGYGSFDMYVTTRATTADPWGPAVNLGSTINSSAADGDAWVSPDGLELYVCSRRSGGCGSGDIYVATREATDDPWGEPQNLGSEVNSAYDDSGLCLSPDGLLLLFSDNFEGGTSPRPGGLGGSDMWMTRRTDVSSPWQASVNLGSPVNSAINEIMPYISRDGSTLYFATNAAGVWDNWQASILAIVDFTGDGYVDGQDLLAIIAQFGQSDPLCDIGPYAWGDGVVDVQDVVALASYIGTEVNDPTLIAHWALDETDGLSALDSAGGNSAFVIGGATWQPDGGQIGGALEFDGIDDCVIPRDSVTHHLGSCFSVIAWIKGGAPNQVVISQGDGADWLFVDPLDGCLATNLKGTSRTQTPLVSEAVVTDGTWHRVGLVWDGASRILRMDGQEVARDAMSQVDFDGTGLLLGAGAELQTGTFWCGLIDDVRIYNRVARP